MIPLPSDAAVFLVRLTRLDPAAVVRLRPQGPDLTALWARLPWDVLVTRTVPRAIADDVTVSAAELLAALSAPEAAGPPPARKDAQWRWALPPAGAQVVEELPAAQVRALGAAAAAAVRSAASGGLGGRALGERAVRDALLDHVPIVVEITVGDATGTRIPVPQRLVQALVQMGFMGGRSADAAVTDPVVRVLVSGGFVGLAGQYGVAWHRQFSRLAVTAIG